MQGSKKTKNQTENEIKKNFSLIKKEETKPLIDLERKLMMEENGD